MYDARGTTGLASPRLLSPAVPSPERVASPPMRGRRRSGARRADRIARRRLGHSLGARVRYVRSGTDLRAPSILRDANGIHIFASSTYRVCARRRRGTITNRVPPQRSAPGNLAESGHIADRRTPFVSPTGSTQASTQAAMRRLESTDASRTSRAMRVTSAFTASGAAISIPVRHTMRDAVVPVLSRVQRAFDRCRRAFLMYAMLKTSGSTLRVRVM